MNLNNYKKQLGKEELSIIQNSANNFVDNFSKVNMSEMVKGLINRSYNRINPVNDNDEMDSIVTSFSNDMVDDAVASRMLTFGAKIAPANYMESLSDLLYRYAKRESQERVDLIRMKIESGDVPTIGEDKKAFTSYVNKVFNTLSLSKRLDENFRADFSNISMEEEDILNTIKKEVIKEVEKTEDKQKLIHDIMEEVQDIKQEYADKIDNNDSDSDTKNELNGSESSKDEVDNSGSDSPDLQNTESFDMESLLNKKKDDKNKDKKEEKVDAKKKKEIENKKKAEDKKAKEDAKNKKGKEAEDNVEGEDEEGVGVTATYQNEDVFGGYSYHNMFESNNFESVGFPILTKELQSFEDAYYSILKNTISETFGSKEFLENAKTKMKMVISEENINKAIESLLSKEQSKFKGIADNIIKYKDSQLNQSLVKSNEDLKNASFEDKKFTINLANSNSVFNEILKTDDKFDKRYGDKFNMEGFDNKLKEKISDFFTKGIKNFASNINKDNSIDIYQNWKLIERSFNINRSFEDFYNLCSYEDFTGTDAINEIQGMVPDSAIIDNKPIVNDAMDDAKIVIKENNDNSEAETKIIDPQRGLEKNKEDEMSDEALKIPLSSYDRVISKEVKKEADSVAKILPKLVEEAVLDVLVRQGQYAKWIEKMDQSYIRKAGLKLMTPQEIAKEYVKHCTFLSSSDINAAIDTSRSLLFAKKKVIPIGALPSPNYFRKYLATKFPRIPDSTLLKIGKFGLEYILTNLVINAASIIPVYGATAAGAMAGAAAKGAMGVSAGAMGGAVIAGVVLQGLLTAGFIIHLIKGAKNSIAGYINNKLKVMNLKYFKSNINLTGFLHNDKLLLQRFASMFGDKINVGLKIDFKLNSKEGFERIYGDDILIPNTIPSSLLKFENSPIFTAEHLSNIFIRKGSDKIMSLENKFNDAIGKLERIAKRDNNNKAVEKLDIWKKNLRDARRIYNQKISAISSIGLSSEHIKDRFKYNPGTQAVVKNLLNRGYLNMEGLPLIGKLTDKKDYEHSIERLVDLTFDFHIRKNRWEKLYENASMAREDLEVREDNLEKALIEATPKDREFAEKLKSSLQFKDLDRFFTFDSIMMDFKTLFYKVNDTVDLKSLIDGDGLKTKVLQGLESKRGYIDDITKLYTDRYLAGSSIESIHPTRLEQFASKILRDTKASSTEEFNVLDDSVSENIRNKSILYLTMEVTRKALGCENARIKSETDQFLLS